MMSQSMFVPRNDCCVTRPKKYGGENCPAAVPESCTHCSSGHVTLVRFTTSCFEKYQMWMAELWHVHMPGSCTIDLSAMITAVYTQMNVQNGLSGWGRREMATHPKPKNTYTDDRIVPCTKKLIRNANMQMLSEHVPINTPSPV